MRDLPAPAVIAISYAVGSIPFSGLVARRLKEVDLREVGTGTVSGTSLYREAGLGPLLVGGILDLAKGSVGPWLAGSHRPGLRALAAGATVAGHNWSVFLGGAGGRGISPAMGAMLAGMPEGSAVLLAGLAAGKAAGSTSLGALVADVALVPVLAVTRRRAGALTALAVVTPMLLKRLLGNNPRRRPDEAGVYLNRLLFDQDDRPRQGTDA